MPIIVFSDARNEDMAEIVGGDHVRVYRFGDRSQPRDWIDATLWKPMRVPATTFYRSIDTMVYKTGGCRESYCRVLIEAYAHGVVPVVEHDYAFPELVIQGETGFMGKTSEEMSYYASFLAMNPSEHRRIAENARDHVARLMSPEACWEGWKDILSD